MLLIQFLKNPYCAKGRYRYLGRRKDIDLKEGMSRSGKEQLSKINDKKARYLAIMFIAPWCIFLVAILINSITTF